MLGRLPGQRRNAMHFVIAPKSLDTRDMQEPGRTGAYWPEPHGEHYAVSDVYFAEVCMLARICSNLWKLFTVGRGEMFYCDFERQGYDTM